MKRKFLLILFFLLLISNVLAISPPLLPFPFGQEIIIDGQPGYNLMIKIENENFDTIRTTTNEEGQFLIDLANFGDGYSVGDKIKVTIYRGDEKRTYEVIIDKEEGGIFFSKSIQWDEKFSTESEKEPDLSTVMTYLKEQEQKNYEESVEDRNLSLAIAIVSLVVSLIFLVISCFVTRHYAIKYGNKKNHRKK